MSCYPSSISRLSPIFLFSNWRNGGTALAMTFRKLHQFYVFTEPFNPTLRNPELALQANTYAWKSKHPAGEFYFSEYAPLFKRPDFFFPKIEDIPYVLGPDDSCDDLYRYLKQLIDFAQEQDKAPVFKFEQLEGSAPWIAANFPGSLRVGVSRDPLHQLISWMEQASLGNNSFFELAHRLIQNNSEYFSSDPIIVSNDGDVEVFKKIFEIFRRRIDIQHHQHMNFCIDIAPETTESKELQLEIIASHDPGRLAEWEHVLREIRLSLHREPEAEVTLRRLSAFVLLKYERAALDESVKVLGQRLDERELSIHKLKEEIDKITGSTEFKMLSKVRKIIDRMRLWS